MKAISVRQPWAWALLHGKDVENRSRNIVGGYRGRVLLHAGQHLADPSAFDRVDELPVADLPVLGLPGAPADSQLRGVIGVVDIVGVHPAASCRGACSPWAEPAGVHIRVDPGSARALDRIVPCPGRLGLFDITDADVVADIRRQVP